MAYNDDRPWRERMGRDDDRRQQGGSRYGEHRGPGSGRGWSEGSEWRNQDRDEWSSGSAPRGMSQGMGSQGMGSQGGHWGDRDRWGERSSSDWEQTAWRDLDRDRDRGAGYEQGREWSRNFPGRDMGQSGMGSRDRRQERDYGGSMRAGEYGREMGRGRSPGQGSQYGSSERGGRSGMGYGGGYSDSQAWRAREHDQYGGMSSEPGFGAGYGAGAPHRGSAESGYGYGGPHDWGGRSRSSDDRGFFDKASDEISSWFGDEDAERRREMDRRHSGRGPRNYARSDSRINEDVCDRLTDHPLIDASDIEVAVANREVTLSGAVRSRDEKRRAEDIAESISGVTHVQNNLRVQQHSENAVQSTLDSFANATSGAFGERGGSTMSSRTGSSTAAGSPSSTASGAPDATKTTTGSSPGVMKPDTGSSTRGS